MGWTSPVLTYMGEDNPVSDNNPLGVKVTDEDVSWIGSLVTIGAVVGSLFSGYLGEKYELFYMHLFSITSSNMKYCVVKFNNSLTSSFHFFS